MLLWFSGGAQYIKVNNGRTLGLFAYSEIPSLLYKKHSAFIANLFRSSKVQYQSHQQETGYAFEVKPGDVDTNGCGWAMAQ